MSVPPVERLREREGVRYREARRRVSPDRFAAFAPRVRAGLEWGVGALLERDGRVVLVREHDRWQLPGGAVEDGEELSGALAREVREETGLGVADARLRLVTDQTITDGDRRVSFGFATFTARAVGADLADPTESDDSIEAIAWHDTLPADTLDRELLAGLR